jgi:hypothetical protein
MVKGSARDPEGPATESSVEAAVAKAEQDGLRFLLRVRLVVLAALAVWLSTNYVLSPAAMLGGRW